MKRYTAVLLDIDENNDNPNRAVNNFESISYYVSRMHTELEKLAKITETKYRFGYMHDELSDTYRKSLGNISHVVTSIWHDGNQILCNIMVLDTTEGKKLQTLIDSGMEFSLVYDFNNCGYSTIDVKCVWYATKCPEKYILKPLDTKDNLQ